MYLCGLVWHLTEGGTWIPENLLFQFLQFPRISQQMRRWRLRASRCTRKTFWMISRYDQKYEVICVSIQFNSINLYCPLWAILVQHKKIWEKHTVHTKTTKTLSTTSCRAPEARDPPSPGARGRMGLPGWRGPFWPGVFCTFREQMRTKAIIDWIKDL